MKVTDCESGLPLPNPDLLSKPIKSRKQLGRRKSKVPGNGVRLRKDSAVNRSSRPETPLLRWKFNEGSEDIGLTKEENEEVPSPPEDDRKFSRKVNVPVSARKLAAAIWRMQLTEVPASGDCLKFQSGDNNVAVPIHCHPSSRVHHSASKDLVQSPCSVSGRRSPCFSKIDLSFQLSNWALESTTKWDPVGWKVSDEINQIHVQKKVVDQDERDASRISTLETELEQAHAKIHELETERRSSRKKLEQFVKKLSQEKAEWRSREHEKVRVIIDDMKGDMNRERKNRQKLELVNSKLVNELSEAKLLAKRYMQEFHKERKSRELIEEVCDELAKEIAEDKAEVEALNRESMDFREEIEEERKMLQIAEVWREERVQMKLIDAKLALEDQYSYMNWLISDLEYFLSSRGGTQDSEGFRKAAELLRQAATSVNIQDFSEFTYEPPNSDDIFSIMEDVNFGDQNEKQIKPCPAHSPSTHSSKSRTVSPQVSMMKKDNTGGHAHPYVDRCGPVEEEASEWETVSHGEDQGSSYSPYGSLPSVNETDRDSNVSRSRIEWEGNTIDQETPITEIGEVYSVPSRQMKKASSISRLWRSSQSNGENCKIISVDGINGRFSNGTLISSEFGSGKGGFSPDLGGQWSSPESGNPHITKAMKGCIEWPRSTQKGSLKSKLLEARIESQKIQLRHVLKQKI